MSWTLDSPCARFSASGPQATSESRSSSMWSQSTGSPIEKKSFFPVRKPRHAFTLPLPTPNSREQSILTFPAPQKRQGTVVKMPAAHQGTYCTVYKGKDAGKLVAIRATRAVRVQDSTRKELERERAVWFHISHQNVQPLLGVISRPDLSAYDCTVSPWYENGSLSNYMKRQKMSSRLRVQLNRNIVNGLSHLHSFNPSIVHGDLKPSNILIDASDRAIICDFGIAPSVREELSKNMTMTVSKVDSIRYVAPELVNRPNSQNPTTQSDVWSLACVIYEIIYSRAPYSHIEATGNASQLALFTEVSNGRPPAKRPSNISREEAQLWKSILEPSWSIRPSRRPTAAFIYQYLEQHAAALSTALP